MAKTLTLRMDNTDRRTLAAAAALLTSPEKTATRQIMRCLEELPLMRDRIRRLEAALTDLREVGPARAKAIRSAEDLFNERRMADIAKVKRAVDYLQKQRRGADIAKAKQAVERLCQGTDAFAKFVGAIEDLVEARAAEIMATTEREARDLDAADVEADTDAPEIDEAALETPEFDNGIDTFRANTPERKQILEDLLAFYRDEETPCLSDNVNTAVWHALKNYPNSRKYINARMRLES